MSDVAGPRLFTTVELVRAYLDAAGRRRPVVRMWMPGLREIRAGALLSPESGYQPGVRTWAQFLAERVGGSSGIPDVRVEHNNASRDAPGRRRD